MDLNSFEKNLWLCVLAPLREIQSQRHISRQDAKAQSDRVN